MTKQLGNEFGIYTTLYTNSGIFLATRTVHKTEGLPFPRTGDHIELFRGNDIFAESDEESEFGADVVRVVKGFDPHLGKPIYKVSELEFGSFAIEMPQITFEQMERYGWFLDHITEPLTTQFILDKFVNLEEGQTPLSATGTVVFFFRRLDKLMRVQKFFPEYTFPDLSEQTNIPASFPVFPGQSAGLLRTLQKPHAGRNLLEVKQILWQPDNENRGLMQLESVNIFPELVSEEEWEKLLNLLREQGWTVKPPTGYWKPFRSVWG